MKRVLLVTLLLFQAIGCNRIARNGALLNNQVSVGIERYQINVEELIRTLADIERGVLEERWEDIYRRSEEMVRASYDIGPDEPLNYTQRLEAATLAASIKEDINAEITLREQSMLEQSRENAQILISTNNTVTAYLQSLEDLSEAQNSISQKIQEITGINPEKIIGTVFSLIEELP